MVETISKTTSPTPVRVVDGASALDRIKQFSASIAQRAHEIFERNGRIPGRESEDWFQAEAELLHPLHVAIAETDDAVTVRAEVPGYKPEGLGVSVDSQLLTITGTREAHEQHKTGKMIYTEHCANQIFRSLELPADVDISKSTATLKDGVLEIAMPKAASAPKARSAAQTA